MSEIPNKQTCQHIAGYGLYAYEGWDSFSVQEGEDRERLFDEWKFFNFCPMCGKKLKKEKRDRKEAGR